MNKYFSEILVICFISILFISCIGKRSPEVKKNVLESVRKVKLEVPEPSGLDLTFKKDGFWTVSDENSRVYRLDNNGKVMHSFKINGVDIEGIAVVNENAIAVVLERSREIILLDTLGREINRKKLDLKGDLNSGLEGITYDSLNKKFYLINEKSPGLLIEVDDNFNELKRTRLKFAKDYSGIFYEKNEDVFWIVSDESQKIFVIDKSGNILEEYGTTIVQAEGISLDYENNMIYFVSDNKEELYECRFERH